MKYQNFSFWILMLLLFHQYSFAQFTVIQTGGVNNPSCAPANALCVNACEGNNITLTATYTGPGTPISYRWQRGFDILPETSNALTITNIAAADASLYRVTALDGSASQMGTIGNIEVSLLETPRNLEIDAPSLSLCTSPPSSMTLTASGDGDIDLYEWFRNGTSLGPASASNTQNISVGGEYYFNAIGCNTVTSPTVTVSTITSAPTGLTITSDDILDPNNVCLTGTLKLNTSLDNPDGVAYQWYFNNLATPITGETNSSYEFSGTDLLPSTTGTYIVVATNGCGTMQQNFTTSIQLPPSGVTLARTPLTGEACADPVSNPITLIANVGMTNGTVIRYDWYKDDVLYRQTNSSTNSLLLTEAGEYTVRVNNKCGASVVSNAIDAVVVQPPTEPKLEGFPTPSIGCGQSTVDLQRNSNGSPDSYIDYKWYRDGVEFSNPSNSYITDLAGTYVIEAFTNNGCGEVFSDTLTVLEVFDAPTTINLQTESNISCGTSAILTASTNAEGVIYEWYQNNTLFTQTNSPTLEVTTSATYKVRAVNACGATGLSADLPISILTTTLITPTISLPDATNTICEGETIRLLANYSGAGSVNFQWFRNNELLVGATEDNIKIEESGNYTVQVSDGLCSRISSIQEVFLDEVADVELLFSGSLEFCEGDSVTIFARSSDTGLSYQWIKNGEDTVGTGTSFTATDAGAYVITLRTTNICGGTQDVNVDLVVTPEASRPISRQGAALLIDENSDFYQWRKNGFPVVGANSNTYVPTDTGSYSVVLTNILGCSRVTQEYQLTELPGSEELFISPNPADDSFGVLVFTEKAVVIRVTDIYGQLYIEESFTETTEGTRFATIDVSDWSTGTYIVWIEGDGFLASEKVLVR